MDKQVPYSCCLQGEVRRWDVRQQGQSSPEKEEGHEADEQSWGVAGGIVKQHSRGQAWQDAWNRFSLAPARSGCLGRLEMSQDLLHRSQELWWFKAITSARKPDNTSVNPWLQNRLCKTKETCADLARAKLNWIGLLAMQPVSQRVKQWLNFKATACKSYFYLMCRWTTTSACSQKKLFANSTTANHQQQQTGVMEIRLMLFDMMNSGYFTWQPLVMTFHYGYSYRWFSDCNPCWYSDEKMLLCL